MCDARGLWSRGGIAQRFAAKLLAVRMREVSSGLPPPLPFKTAFELHDAGTRRRCPRASVAALQEVIPYSSNHRAVVGTKLKRRENAADVASFGEHGAEP